MYKVVIVDDEPFIVTGISQALEWSGFNFEIALASTKPVEALSYIRENPVHLLITDISMPELDGVSLIREVKKIDSKIAVLVLSAFSDFDFVKSAMCSGAENYLLKPLDPDELAQSVSQVAAHLEKRNTLYEKYGTNLLTFRSTFVESWVKGNLTGAELTERAGLLGVNLEEESRQVVILTMKNKDEMGMAEIFDLLLTRMIGRVMGHFFFESPWELVCVLMPLVKKAAGVTSFVREILSEASKSGREGGMFVSIGPVVSDCTQVCRSYREARRYLFLRYTGEAMELSLQEGMAERLRERVEQKFDEISMDAYVGEMQEILTIPIFQLFRYF